MKRSICIVFVLLLVMGLSAQSKRSSKVYLEHSNTLSFDKKRMPDAQILRGNVRFRHDSALMYCDSAYFFQSDNSLHAFGHVHLVQGDSLEGFGDVLYYNGNTKMARFRRHVRLIHNGTVLTTDSLNYDRARDKAYYFSGGTIEDRLNTLTSVRGLYTPKNNQAVFSGDVHLLHPKFTLTSDTLCYNTATYQADLVSPTTIIYEQETTILSSNGWYNTKTEHSALYDRSQIIHADGMTLTGDTIYYDKQQGYGNVRGHMQSVDSTHHMTLLGNRGEIWDQLNHGYATDSALLVDWSDSVVYTYMHADTLFTQEFEHRIYQLVEDSVWQDSVWMALPEDTLWIDTSYVSVWAYYNVRLYREDLQLVCDSMHYEGKDSLATLCGDPVCWNADNQVSADTVVIYFRHKRLDYLHGMGNAIAIKKEGDAEYDQMAGKEMLAYIKDGDIDIVDVMGNAETVFYPREEDGAYIGVNKTQSSFVKVFFENRAIYRVLLTTATACQMIPLVEATPEERFLVTFFWADNERPRDPQDLFSHPARTPRPDAQAVSAAAEEEEEEDEEEEPKRKGKKRNRK